ncbi:hypothetical protein [Actinomadura kijaniata]|uniref:hypothetical protein n=1 Tax=Actinomadura kijaniata TaxID=46161 RepID=UPI0012F95333|nr:hypothetical protein [Actinomadura kijaniata]
MAFAVLLLMQKLESTLLPREPASAPPPRPPLHRGDGDFAPAALDPEIRLVMEPARAPAEV